MAVNTQEFERTDRALADTFNENLVVPINEMVLEHNTHIADTDVHVTLEKQTAWDGNTTDITAMKAVKTAIISTSGWSGTAPFYVAITVTDLTDSRPDVIPIYSATLATALLEKESWNKISYIDCTANTMTVYCLEEIPTTAINIEIVGV